MAEEDQRRDDDVEELLGVRAGQEGSLVDDEDDLRSMYHYLIEAGVPFDRLRAATEHGEPQTALIEYRLLGDDSRYDIDAVAARAGLAPAAVVELLRALGLAVPAPGQAMLSTPELRAAQVLAQAQSLFGEEMVLRFARVMRAAMSRVAEAAVSMFGVGVQDPLRERGGTHTDLIKAADRALCSLPLVPELFGELFAHQALDAVRRMAVMHGKDTSYETVTVSVGFADLVGSTGWAQGQTPRELADALGEFERLAQASLSGRARLVKTIGDEVMFFAPTPVEACSTAFNLVRAVAREPKLPALRAGLAHGRAVALDGDLYGSVVNLAARLVHQGEPGQVVADAVLAASGQETDLMFTALTRRRLSGFNEPVMPYLVVQT